MITEKMLDTYLNIGIKLLSDEQCCQLLAWVHKFGDENIAVVKNIKLSEDIKHAQKRLNLYSGQIPNAQLLPMLNDYIRDLEGLKELPPWVFELHKRYGLKPPEK